MHLHDRKTGTVGIGKSLVAIFLKDFPSPSFCLIINGYDLQLITLFNCLPEGYSGIRA